VTGALDRHTRASPSWGPGHLVQLAGFTIAFAAAAVFGLTWAVVPGAGTPIWPASGLAFAVLVLGGLRFWPGIFLGRILAAMVLGSPQPWWAVSLLAAGSVLGGVLPAWLVRRSGFDPTLSRLSDILMLIAAALGSAALSGVPGMLSLWASGTPVALLPNASAAWVLGNTCGMLLAAPVLLTWSSRDAWRMTPRAALHLAGSLAVVTAVAAVIFLNPPYPLTPTWYMFPLLVWPALAFSVRGASLALAICGAFVVTSCVMGVGPFLRVAEDTAGRLAYGQQFVAITAITILVLAAVADERRARRQILAGEQRLLEERRALETLNASGAAIAAELDVDAVVQTVTDAGVALTGAKFGAFFYNTVGPEGEAYTLFSLSGAPRSAFERFGMPRNTMVFAPTFEGAEVVRVGDITRDPRYGKNEPHQGMPKGHLPVRSYLAVPVRSRTGEVMGGLFFGHPEANVFTARAEGIMTGIAAQAAIALDNAQLYKAAQAEISERRAVEAHQQLLINELNHRVKNTLATVQSFVGQSLRTPQPHDQLKAALTARIIALSRAHDVITARTWQGAYLREVVDRAVEPFLDDAAAGGPAIAVEGPEVWLQPRAALAIAMALHELGTNAAKHGALATPGGRVTLRWTWNAEGRELRLVWRESGGSPVCAPLRRGFGSRLIEQGLKADLSGAATLAFEPAGVVCEIVARLDPEGA